MKGDFFMNNNPSVSVIMPAYNCEKLIGKSIESVIKQTYKNWELIIIDDCSTDDSYLIACEFAEKDYRIKVFKQSVNDGVAAARNTGIMAAQGDILMYLDSDDIWSPRKMEIQVMHMQANQIEFSCTSYEVIDEGGEPKGKVVKMLPVVDYKGFLLNNLIQIVGVAVNVKKIGKELLLQDKSAMREDAASWLKILKAGYKCYGLPEILAQYRRVENSRSSNKLKVSSGMWCLYQKEGLSLLFSCSCFVRYTLLAIWKRLYSKDKESQLLK